jgi:hypothetical protein
MVSNASSAFRDGNKLVAEMREYEKAVRNTESNWLNVGTYEGYVLGVFDVVEQSICTPDNIKAGQLFAVVAKYLNEHPEQWSFAADTLVFKALSSAFPCKTTPTEK